MISEALTMTLADMVFIDSINASGETYDFSKRRIFPLVGLGAILARARCCPSHPLADVPRPLHFSQRTLESVSGRMQRAHHVHQNLQKSSTAAAAAAAP